MYFTCPNNFIFSYPLRFIYVLTITNQSYLKWRSNGENQNQQCNIPTVSRESICQLRYKIMQTSLQKKSHDFLYLLNQYAAKTEE